MTTDTTPATLSEDMSAASVLAAVYKAITGDDPEWHHGYADTGNALLASHRALSAQVEALKAEHEADKEAIDRVNAIEAAGRADGATEWMWLCDLARLGAGFTTNRLNAAEAEVARLQALCSDYADDLHDHQQLEAERDRLAAERDAIQQKADRAADEMTDRWHADQAALAASQAREAAMREALEEIVAVADAGLLHDTAGDCDFATSRQIKNARAALSAPAPSGQAGELARELAEALLSASEMIVDEGDVVDVYPASMRDAETARARTVEAALTKARAAGLLLTDTTTTTKDGAQADAPSRQAAQGE